MSRAERDDSLLRLVGSFVGINVLIAGVFVVLIPHMVAMRVARRLRRLTPHLRQRRPFAPSAAVRRPGYRVSPSCSGR